MKSNRWISRRNVPGHGQQAEAEREKRAKVIPAEGELLASEKLAQAAAVIGQPVAIQLRYLSREQPHGSFPGSHGYLSRIEFDEEVLIRLATGGREGSPGEMPGLGLTTESGKGPVEC